MRILKQKNFDLSVGIGGVILLQIKGKSIIYTARLHHKQLNIENYDIMFGIKEIKEGIYDITVQVYDKVKGKLIGQVTYMDEGVIEHLINEGTILDKEQNLKIMTDENMLLRDLKYNYSLELHNVKINREQRVIDCLENLEKVKNYLK